MRTGSVLARNTFFNVLTQAGVGLIALVAIPFVVRGLGEEDFGLLTTVWVVVGYFSILDLGLSQASVKFLARHFDQKEWAEANKTIVVSVIGSLVLGIAIALLIVLAAPVLTESILRIAPERIATARVSMRLVALAVPCVLVQGSLRAVPMAVQRFDLVNIVQALSGVLQWGGSLLIVLKGGGLVEIVLLTVVTRMLSMTAAYWIVLKVFPAFKWLGLRQSSSTLPRLLRFGGWVSVSQVVSPIVGYLDRIFIGAFLSMRAVAFYTVPFEALSRFQIFPSSLTMTLFPALAAKSEGGPESQSLVRELYGRSLTYVLLAILPASLVLAVFSREILTLWLGPGEFPQRSSLVFTLLALAACVQAVAYIPVTSLQATGRPDIAAKFYLAEIPLYVLLCLALIPSYGIDGAAMAWLIRLVLITTGLLVAAHFTFRGSAGSFRVGPFWRGFVLNAVLCILLLGLKALSGSLILDAVSVGLMLAGYGTALWFFCLDGTDRMAFQYLLLIRRKGHA